MASAGLKYLLYYAPSTSLCTAKAKTLYTHILSLSLYGLGLRCLVFCREIIKNKPSYSILGICWANMTNQSDNVQPLSLSLRLKMWCQGQGFTLRA